MGKSEPQINLIKISQWHKNNPVTLKNWVIYTLGHSTLSSLALQLATEEYEAEASMKLPYWWQ